MTADDDLSGGGVVDALSLKVEIFDGASLFSLPTVAIPANSLTQKAG